MSKILTELSPFPWSIVAFPTVDTLPFDSPIVFLGNVYVFVRRGEECRTVVVAENHTA